MSTKSSESRRFIGWQRTPIHQSSFGGGTKGGKLNQSFELKFSTGPKTEVKKSWYLLDAAQLPIGRLATLAASLLMGKHRASFTPGAGSGDFVIVINAKKAFFTSNKDEKKVYYWHTGYFGGLKLETAGDALRKHPQKVIMDAVAGMMPKSKLSRYQLTNLKIYDEAEHPHHAQKPNTVSMKTKSLLKSIDQAEVN